jgi:hypothetical protein
MIIYVSFCVLLSWISELKLESFQSTGGFIEEFLVRAPVQQNIAALGSKEVIVRVLHSIGIGLQERAAVGCFTKPDFDSHGDTLPGPTAPFGRVPTAAWSLKHHLLCRGSGQCITLFKENRGRGLLNLGQ